ncbi:hypothetical protein GDO81_026221 [Engystomops pustulosus]|uniref:Sodefrin-like factor n=1 Tax=Engystomops pustulosus TaxID=76066 RepID=A0AAV6ZQD0_ENGPU|nr:hypothetical protein GDO81_026221 [Engystomops pustulosus]
MIVPVVILSLLSALEVTMRPFPLPNGFVCPYCVSDGSIPCKASDTEQCIGASDVCYSITVYKSGGIILRTAGCSTQDICKFGNYSYSLKGEDYRRVITCSKAKRP